MLDILNEKERCARPAALTEDFLEKTDLRVRYPGLNRRRGARVQVTSIIAPEQHQAKLEAINLAQEFVVLSPLTLAQFVQSNTDGLTDIMSSTELAQLWQNLEGKPADVAELAFELKRILLRSFAAAHQSPLGPLMAVPPAIRGLVRAFVKTQAFGSTNRLREREESS